ncbi:transcriptional regulator [Mycobacterium sp. ACS1612]|nr:transcriptional regulator [Mycobacterium sp. ACS1612]
MPRADTVRVVLVLDVPAAPADLPSRTAQLADDYAQVIVRSVPGVHAHRAAVDVATANPTVPPAGLTIDRILREVRIDGNRVRLTYREFELLCYLAAVPGRPVSRAELVNQVWRDRAPGTEVSLRTVDTHVRRLRTKLGPYAGVLTTIRGRGYRFDPGPKVRFVAA